MTRKTLKPWVVSFTSVLALACAFLFITELFDNRRSLVVQPPDKVTSFLEMLDLGELVTTAASPDVELKFVTQGSGGGTGQFKDDQDPSVYRGTLLQAATCRKRIGFEMTCDAKIGTSLLLQLKDALQNSLSRWEPNVRISEHASSEGLAGAEVFMLEYRAEGQSGEYEGEIKIEIKEVPKELMRPTETGSVIHSLSIAGNEARWGHE